MSITYQADGFNEDTYDRLLKQQEKAGEGITPDNISFFYADSIDYQNKSDIEFLLSSSINGINVNNIYELIGYLKTNKTELTSLQKEFNIIAEKSDFEIEIPDSYDGRNSFVLTAWNYSSALNGATESFYSDSKRLINRMFRGRDGSTDPYKASFYTTKNKQAIRISCDNYDKDSIDGKYWTCKVLVLLWRFI